MILARMLWLIGWLARKVGLAVSWMGAAIKIGWDDARATRGHTEA